MLGKHTWVERYKMKVIMYHDNVSRIIWNFVQVDVCRPVVAKAVRINDDCPELPVSEFDGYDLACFKHGLRAEL